MDIKGKLAPLASQARTSVVNTLATAESAILRLPRPFSALSNDVLGRNLSLSVIRLITAGVSLKTGKAVLMFNVKDRHLTKYGRGAVIATLGMGSVLLLLNVHESLARLREPKSSNDFELEHRELLRVRGGFKKN